MYYCNYQFKLKHDDGITVIRFTASSVKSAKERISSLERCPLRAITYVPGSRVRIA